VSCDFSFWLLLSTKSLFSQLGGQFARFTGGGSSSRDSGLIIIFYILYRMNELLARDECLRSNKIPNGDVPYLETKTDIPLVSRTRTFTEVRFTANVSERWGMLLIRADSANTPPTLHASRRLGLIDLFRLLFSWSPAS
jgi:hypothetical protein